MEFSNKPVQFPSHHNSSISKRPERCLLLCFFNSKLNLTPSEELVLIQQKSSFPITILNLYEHGYGLSPNIKLDSFNAIIIHSTVITDKFDQQTIAKLKGYHGAKIHIIQGENCDREYKDAFDYDLKFSYQSSSIETIIDDFNEKTFDILDKKQALNKPRFCSINPAKNILLLAAHEPVKDPRLSWIVNSCPSDMNIVQLGVDLTHNESILLCQNEIFLQKSDKTLDEQILIEASKNSSGVAALYEIREIQRILNVSEEDFCTQYTAPFNHPRITNFKWYLRYIINVTTILLDQATNMRGLHGIIATDLPTLPAALILKGIFNIPVFYDAHEYWPEADVEGLTFENEFWVSMEGRLLPHTDYRQTVSSCLAEFMKATYNIHFESVPNCIPLFDEPLHDHTSKQSLQTKFIFQGNFAPGRGLDLLINTWSETTEEAILILRGPDIPYKDEMIKLAKKTGLLGTRILFPSAVDESQLVSALNDADIGVIPYTPLLANYTHCCPNKMSQYFAAKLPVLANNTKYVEEVIRKSQSGLVVDFTDSKALVNAINEFLKDKAVSKAMGENGYQFFREQFHWEKASLIFYQAMDRVITNSNNMMMPLEVYTKQERLSMYHKKTTIGVSIIYKPLIDLIRRITPYSTIKIIKKYLPNDLKQIIRKYSV